MEVADSSETSTATYKTSFKLKDCNFVIV